MKTKKVKKSKKKTSVKKVIKKRPVSNLYTITIIDDKGNKKNVKVIATSLNLAIKKVASFYSAPMRSITKIVKVK